MKKTKGKKISIVFEETGATAEGQGFNVYVEGFDADRANLSMDELSPAEFYVSRFFDMIIQQLRKAGTIRDVRENKKKTDHH